jgi:hypothetical protein
MSLTITNQNWLLDPARTTKGWFARLALAAFVFYLVWNTGIHSDDYLLIKQVRQWNWMDYVFPDLKSIGVLIFGPISYYFDYFTYVAFGFHTLWAYDAVKAITSLLCIFLIQRFAADYLPTERAWAVAIVYVLLPNHDATLYWVLTLVYVLTPALIMYSHHLVRTEKHTQGALVGLLGAFTSHASPPLTFGLGVIFLVERAYKKAAIFLAPGVLYVCYYFAVHKIPDLHGGRIIADLSLTVLAKYYLLQFGSFLDAAVGPSFWLKIWYSVGSIDLISVLVGLLSLAYIFHMWPAERAALSKPLLAGLVAVTLLALAMFALTGLYPQMAFNLGNRVMVYGTLLTAFAFVTLPLGRLSMLALATVFVMATLGLSDHWKAWNIRQQKVIANIRAQSPNLTQIPKDAALLVTGYPYSQLGAISHIEFFTETFIVESVFDYALGATHQFRLHALRNWHSVEKETLIDVKYEKRFFMGRTVWLYNAETDTLQELSTQEVGKVIEKLPDVPRHWIQQLGHDNFLKASILKLMPRLKYAFDG